VTPALTARETLETAGVMGGQIAGVTGPIHTTSSMESSLDLEGQIKCQLHCATAAKGL